MACCLSQTFAVALRHSIAVSCFGWVSTVASAANIEVVPASPGKAALVTIVGSFEHDDIEQFRIKTDGLTRAIVVLASDGGNLAAGIDIGTTIRLKGYFSIVPDNARCASACALAWLGGAKRFMGRSAQIGFHAAYVVKDGVSTETSAGNALVGAYLNRIGLPDQAVVYITAAAPNQITWLNLADAGGLGIEVSPFTMPANNAISGAATRSPKKSTNTPAASETPKPSIAAAGPQTGTPERNQYCSDEADRYYAMNHID